MSRKFVLSLAAALVAASSFTFESANARGFGGFGGGFGHFGGIGHGGRLGGARLLGGGYRGHGGRLIPIFGHGGGHGGLIPIRGPRHPRPPRHPFPPIGWHGHHHWHGHWVFRGGEWIVVDDVAVGGEVTATAVADPATGPCTCLIKTYTPTGLVVFSDMCTKEQASAPVNADTSDASQTPTSTSAAPMSAAQVSLMSKAVDYDGRTYADYLAANPGLAQTLASQPSQTAAPDSQPAPVSTTK